MTDTEKTSGYVCWSRPRGATRRQDDAVYGAAFARDPDKWLRIKRAKNQRRIRNYDRDWDREKMRFAGAKNRSRCITVSTASSAATATAAVFEETGSQFLERLGEDASKWAAEFRKTAISLGYSDMDEGWLLSWFANAIEHSSLLHRLLDEARAERDAKRIEVLETAIRLAFGFHQVSHIHAALREAINA